jgi:hypothetical protein
MIGDLEQRVLEWAEIRKRMAHSAAFRAGWEAARLFSRQALWTAPPKPIPPRVRASLKLFGFDLDADIFDECEHPVRVRNKRGEYECQSCGETFNE